MILEVPMIGLILALIINLGIFITMAIVFYGTRKDEEGNVSVENVKHSLVFFTTLSNLFSALTSLVIAIVEINLLTHGSTDIPLWALVLKYVGTAAVTVTLMTVLVFLGPTQGYPNMFRGSGIYVHLIGPLLSIISLCFLETSARISFPLALLGVLPTIFYGTYYLRKVVIVNKENGGWDDFYGFNRGGQWKIYFSAMVIGTFLLCMGLMALHNAMV